MTLGEIITLYRANVQDEQEPYFCSDELLTLYANEGQDEACRRGAVLIDSTSAACTVSYQPNDRSVAIDPRFLLVMDAIDEDGWPLDRIEAAEMACLYPSWRAETRRGRPGVLVQGLDSDRLHLWPRPAVAGSIALTVRRLPLVRLADLNDVPEIRSEAHPALADWLAYKAHSRQDTELFNETKARAALQRFEAEFGPKASLRNETWVREGQGLMPEPLA